MSKPIPWPKYTEESWEPVRSGLIAGDSFRDHVGREMVTDSGETGVLGYDQIKRWARREREAGRLPGDSVHRQQRAEKLKQETAEPVILGRDRRLHGKWALLTSRVRNWLVWLALAKPERWSRIVDEGKWETTSGRRVTISYRTVQHMIERYGPGGDAAFRSAEERELDPYLRGLG